jgi:hypothetical protein
MSWHFENTGTADDVTAAIDEAVANPHGMPTAVGDYLKSAVDACRPSIAVFPTGALVRVRSIGHRPLGVGGQETAEVQLVRSGPSSPRPAP